MFQYIVYAVGLAVLLSVARFLYLITKSSTVTNPPQKKRTALCKTLVILGSGGHTAEMLRLLGGMNLENYSPRIYIAAEGDKMSQDKVTKFETSLQNKLKAEPSSNDVRDESIVKTIPRARKVKQSYFTSIFSTLYAFLYSIPLVLGTLPDLLLCNGPGTCIPLCVLVYLLKFLAVKDVKIIYVESVCRVEHLSLSGLILYYSRIADHLFVQWPQLKDKYSRVQYIGRIV